MSTPSTPSAGIPENLLAMNLARPAGVSLLDAMAHQYEKETGRKSMLPASTVAKIETARLSNSATPTASSLPVGKAFVEFIKTGKHPAIYQQQQARSLLDFARSLILENARNQSTAAPSPSKATTPAKATAPAASKPAPAKPITATKGRTGEQFLALSPEDAAAINKTCCFADRSGELRAELQKALEAMPAGENRSKFYQRFKGAFQAASGFIAKK
jgi:hypothetical protein